jgi:hypothetical protein
MCFADFDLTARKQDLAFVMPVCPLTSFTAFLIVPLVAGDLHWIVMLLKDCLRTESEHFEDFQIIDCLFDRVFTTVLGAACE